MRYCIFRDTFSLPSLRPQTLPTRHEGLRPSHWLTGSPADPSRRLASWRSLRPRLF
jgi:hypothetical protein